MIVISPICGNESGERDTENKGRAHIVNKAISTKDVGKEASSIFHLDFGPLFLHHLFSMFVVYSSEILISRSMRMPSLKKRERENRGHTGSERTW